MKKLIITQSNYIPWKGFFDSMAAVDELMLYDDMQYTRRDWRNRNKIKTPKGAQWMTVPVEVKGKFFQKIKETKVSDPDWWKDHLNLLRQNYYHAPYYGEVHELVESWYQEASRFEYLSEINAFFLRHIADYLEISTPITWSSDYELAEGKTERLVDLCIKRGATDYYTGPAAKNYMDETLFEKAGIAVHYWDYSGYEEYPQLYPPFDHAVSILDLIYNCGKTARTYMKCGKK